MATWQLSQGSGDSWTVPIVDSDGVAIACAGTETLSGNIWPGGNSASLVTLTPTFLSAAGGTTTVAILAASTTALAPATYSVRCKVDDATYYLGSLQILPSPGADVDLPTYCTHADLLNCIPWLDSIQGKNLAGFPVQRAAARQWTDNLIQRHYRGGGGLSRDNYFLPWPQYIPGNPNRLTSIFRSGAASPALQGWLDADGLKLSLPIVEANVYYAIAKILDQQIAKGGENQYRDLAREFYARAENVIVHTDAEIDASGEAYATTSQTVKLGSVDTLEG